MSIINEIHLKSLSRPELQKLAKANDIKANLKNDLIIKLLLKKYATEDQPVDAARPATPSHSQTINKDLLQRSSAPSPQIPEAFRKVMTEGLVTPRIPAVPLKLELPPTPTPSYPQQQSIPSTPPAAPNSMPAGRARTPGSSASQACTPRSPGTDISSRSSRHNEQDEDSDRARPPLSPEVLSPTVSTYNDAARVARTATLDDVAPSSEEEDSTASVRREMKQAALAAERARNTAQVATGAEATATPSVSPAAPVAGSSSGRAAPTPSRGRQQSPHPSDASTDEELEPPALDPELVAFYKRTAKALGHSPPPTPPASVREKWTAADEEQYYRPPTHPNLDRIPPIEDDNWDRFSFHESDDVGFGDEEGAGGMDEVETEMKECELQRLVVCANGLMEMYNGHMKDAVAMEPAVIQTRQAAIRVRREVQQEKAMRVRMEMYTAYWNSSAKPKFTTKEVWTGYPIRMEKVDGFFRELPSDEERLADDSEDEEPQTGRLQRRGSCDSLQAQYSAASRSATSRSSLRSEKQSGPSQQSPPSSPLTPLPRKRKRGRLDDHPHPQHGAMRRERDVSSDDDQYNKLPPRMLWYIDEFTHGGRWKRQRQDSPSSSPVSSVKQIPRRASSTNAAAGPSSASGSRGAGPRGQKRGHDSESDSDSDQPSAKRVRFGHGPLSSPPRTPKGKGCSSVEGCSGDPDSEEWPPTIILGTPTINEPDNLSPPRGTVTATHNATPSSSRSQEVGALRLNMTPRLQAPVPLRPPTGVSAETLQRRGLFLDPGSSRLSHEYNARPPAPAPSTPSRQSSLARSSSQRAARRSADRPPSLFVRPQTPVRPPAPQNGPSASGRIPALQVTPRVPAPSMLATGPSNQQPQRRRSIPTSGPPVSFPPTNTHLNPGDERFPMHMVRPRLPDRQRPAESQQRRTSALARRPPTPYRPSTSLTEGVESSTAQRLPSPEPQDASPEPAAARSTVESQPAVEQRRGSALARRPPTPYRPSPSLARAGSTPHRRPSPEPQDASPEPAAAPSTAESQPTVEQRPFFPLRPPAPGSLRRGESVPLTIHHLAGRLQEVWRQQQREALADADSSDDEYEDSLTVEATLLADDEASETEQGAGDAEEAFLPPSLASSGPHQATPPVEASGDSHVTTDSQGADDDDATMPAQLAPTPTTTPQPADAEQNADDNAGADNLMEKPHVGLPGETQQANGTSTSASSEDTDDEATDVEDGNDEDVGMGALTAEAAIEEQRRRDRKGKGRMDGKRNGSFW